MPKFSIRIHVAIALLFASTLSFANIPSHLHPIQGPSIPLSQFKGQWVILNFWASWCSPCLDEIQTFNHFYQTHRKTVRLFAVNIDDLDPSQQLQIAQQFRLSYPSLDASKTRNSLDESIDAVPATLVISPEGVLHKLYYGQMTYANLTKLIRQNTPNQLSSRD